MPKWRNRASLHNRADRAGAPATDLDAQRLENPRRRMRRGQSRQSRRARATRWDEAEFRWRAGMAFKISSQFSVLGFSVGDQQFAALTKSCELGTENFISATRLLAH